MTDIRTVEMRTVETDEAGMRLDRWFKVHYPGLGFARLQKLIRSGQVRVDGGRAQASTRLGSGQTVRVPPLAGPAAAPQTSNTIRDRHDRDVLQTALLFEDDHVLVFNKPAGLAVQGGSGVNRHVDGMLESFRDRHGRKPRLVHRLDRETAGVLIVARTRAAATALGKSFHDRKTRKLYWAVVHGVPRPPEGRISTFLLRGGEGDRVSVVPQGTAGAEHAVSHYLVADQAGKRVSLLAMRPITGRTHQLRVHAAHIGHPIIGDPKYFDVEDFELPGGLQNRLHLLARRIVIPHPSGLGVIDVSAPLPPHMQQTFAVLGFDEAAGEAAEARL